MSRLLFTDFATTTAKDWQAARHTERAAGFYVALLNAPRSDFAYETEVSAADYVQRRLPKLFFDLAFQRKSLRSAADFYDD